MLRATGLDLGSTGTRRVSAGLLWGSPRPEPERAATQGPLVANVPSEMLTFRRLNLPPAGREVRERVVREELAWSLPFSLEEAAWDWTEGDDVASVLVAPRGRLEELREAVGERASLDGEPLSYLRAARACGCEDALVFDFGASRTTLCAVKDGTLDWVRVSFRGGAALTRKLSAERGLSLEEAEELKHQQGLQLPECQEWLGSLVDEALLPRPLPFERVLLCGGGAQMPGLREALSARLGHPAELFPVPEPLSAFRDVPAWGAALAARPRQPRVQLRPAAPPAAALKPFYLLWIVALLGLATVNLEIRHATLARHQAQQAALLQAALKQQAPGLAQTPPDKLAEVLSRQVEAAREARLRSPALLLGTLGRLAQPLQALTGLQVRAVGYEDGVLTLEGQATSAQQAEKFRGLAGAILDEAELIENRAGPGGRTRFTLEGKVREP